MAHVHHSHDHLDHSHHDNGQGAIDPVCGMSVDPHDAKWTHVHGSKTYYFCAANCRTKFMADPARYLDPEIAKAALEAIPEGTIFTCPMHPEIEQVGPGTCPICGMALEPKFAGADVGPNHELIDMTRRFWIGLVITLPIFALEMGRGAGTAQADRTVQTADLRRFGGGVWAADLGVNSPYRPLA